MNDNNRILIIGRYQDTMEEVTRVLEGVGFIVTGTMNDGVAIDLAASSEYDALLFGAEVSQSERGYIITEVRKSRPYIAFAVVNGPESVLTQVRQAGIKF